MSNKSLNATRKLTEHIVKDYIREGIGLGGSLATAALFLSDSYIDNNGNIIYIPEEATKLYKQYFCGINCKTARRIGDIDFYPINKKELTKEEFDVQKRNILRNIRSKDSSITSNGYLSKISDLPDEVIPAFRNNDGTIIIDVLSPIKPEQTVRVNINNNLVRVPNPQELLARKTIPIVTDYIGDEKINNDFEMLFDIITTMYSLEYLGEYVYNFYLDYSRKLPKDSIPLHCDLEQTLKLRANKIAKVLDISEDEIEPVPQKFIELFREVIKHDKQKIFSSNAICRKIFGFTEQARNKNSEYHRVKTFKDTNDLSINLLNNKELKKERKILN